MNGKIFVIILTLGLGFSTEIHAQLFDVLNKPMYEARVKLLDEFYARFNGKEQRKGVEAKYADRKSNILMLLDYSRFKSREDSVTIYVINPDPPTVISQVKAPSHFFLFTE